MRLSKDEKTQGRELISRYMLMNPVRFSDQGRHTLQRSGFLAFITKNNFLYKSMAIAVVLLITMTAGGGISFASESALPGDLLYPVKVEVNENIRSVFAVSKEAKVEWKVEQAERRLQEAEKLAVQGELEGSAAVTVETKFEQHTRAFDQIIAQFTAEGNAEATASAHSNLEAALEAHARILAAIQDSGRNGAVTSMLAKVQSRAQVTTQARAEAEAMVSASTGSEVRVAAEGKLQAAKNKIAETKSFIAKSAERADAEAIAKAEAKVVVAEQAVAAGEARIAAQAYGEAFVLLQGGIRSAQEAIVLLQGDMSIRADLNLDVLGEAQENKKESDAETSTESNAEIESETRIEGDVENGGIDVGSEINFEEEINL